ncbi:unnamed protein product, partial [Mesorhabditis belari]|uniref:Uncharacterized protein n=1 Tax=Mesorhabditis belari TaxID=2138241 RepID=A0AAF3J4W3_9BILA
MFLRKFWNEWTLQENARRMKITVLPSGTKRVHLKSASELEDMERRGSIIPRRPSRPPPRSSQGQIGELGNSGLI